MRTLFRNILYLPAGAAEDEFPFGVFIAGARARVRSSGNEKNLIEPYGI